MSVSEPSPGSSNLSLSSQPIIIQVAPGASIHFQQQNVTFEENTQVIHNYYDPEFYAQRSFEQEIDIDGKIYRVIADCQRPQVFSCFPAFFINQEDNYQRIAYYPQSKTYEVLSSSKLLQMDLLLSPFHFICVNIHLIFITFAMLCFGVYVWGLT